MFFSILFVYCKCNVVSEKALIDDDLILTNLFYIQLETRRNLSNFEGKNSISSAELFGDGTQRSNSSSSYLSNTDLGDIKDGVRDGVTKVASKLSRLANGVLSSMQVQHWCCYSCHIFLLHCWPRGLKVKLLTNIQMPCKFCECFDVIITISDHSHN